MRVTLGCLLSGCLAYGEILHSSGLVIYNRFPVLVQEERQTAFGVILVWVEHPALPFALFFYLVLEGGGSDVLALLRIIVAEIVINLLAWGTATVLLAAEVFVRPGYDGLANLLP